MNQLELFPQEIISVAFHHRADVVYFEFESQRAWTSFLGVVSLESIFRENGAPNFSGTFLVNAFTGFSAQEFLCSVGTWKKLSLQADFLLSIPPWVRKIFDTEESI